MTPVRPITAVFFAVCASAALATAVPEDPSRGGDSAPVHDQRDAWPTPPVVTSSAWFDWYEDMLAARLAACPRERSITFHFSQSGDDTTGNGSLAAPYRSLAKAQEILDTHPDGGIALLFRRGDSWREPEGVLASAPGVTIADYGAGDKPYFTPFQSVAPALWQPDPLRPGVYILDESATYFQGLTTDVVWVRQDANRDAPLARMSVPSAVEATPGSWHWDHTTAKLYVHPRPSQGGAPVDPRLAPPFDVLRPSKSGVYARGHGSRIENIVAEGWGLSRTVTATQDSGIKVGASGGDHVVVVGCESYYNPSHAIAHWAHTGIGGVVTFLGCRAGLCNFNTANETIYNTYAVQGGMDVVFEACEVAYGTLPSDNWAFATRRRGRGFYGHTNGGAAVAALIVARNCVVRGDRLYGCASPSSFNDLRPAAAIEDVRCFIVGEVFHGGPDADGFVATVGNAAKVNCLALSVQAAPGGAGSFHSWTGAGWAINCAYDLDVRQRTGRYALTNPPPGGMTTSKFWNCSFRVQSAINGLAFSLDFDVPTGATAAELRHCVLTHVGPGEARVGLGDPASVQHNNAYFGFTAASIQGDPSPILLTAPIGPWEPQGPASPTCLAREAAAGRPDADLEFDAFGRTGWRRDVGAFDWSRLYGDLNGDQICDVEDVIAWEQGPVDVNGDLVVNAADRDWLLRSARWRELDDMSRMRR